MRLGVGVRSLYMRVAYVGGGGCLGEDIEIVLR